jgi:hypothetical protein
MADGLESGALTGDPVLDLMMERLPKFKIMDKVIEDPKGIIVECFNYETREPEKYKVPFMKVGKMKIPLLAKPDTMKPNMTAFKEYKTGQARWTQHKADNWGQITFYALAIYLIKGKIPSDIELVHVQTEKQANVQLDKNIGGIGATGDMFRYPTSRNMMDVMRMMVRIKTCWTQIIKITEKELL